MNFEKIRDEALKLSAEEREQLVDAIWESLEPEVSPAEGAEWQRRLEELESGKVKGIPVEETLARMERELERIRESQTASAR